MVSIVGCVALNGCAIFSPVQTDEQYIQADGVPLTTTNIEFENLVIVAPARDAGGVLVGQAVNQTRQPIQVTFAVAGAAPTTITIAPAAADAITAIPSNVDLGPIPEPPGAMVQLSVSTAASGTSLVLVPVLPPGPQGSEYEDITP
ncbi:MAG: hypothetical protein WBL35_10440 [Ornithinibacter sp.]